MADTGNVEMEEDNENSDSGEVMDTERMSSDESDSEDSSSDEDGENAAQIEKRNELQKQVDENPYVYDGHIQLIKYLRKIGELESLRNARKKMSELFPLSEELWLDWLQDEIGLVSEDTDRAEIESLFDKAVRDYLSIPIWLEYVQFAIGGMGREDGMKKAREVFDRALTACGLHVTKGANLWEAYREFENAILAGLMPQPGMVANKELGDKFSVQHDRVEGLFKRQLTIPLFDMEETFEEYKEWLQDEPDTYTKQTYHKALAKLEKVKPYEDNLLTAEPPRLAAYEEYLEHEESEGDPARTQCLYERALQENCLNHGLWLKYIKYLDHKLKVESVSVPVYERAVQNCPWCVQLWQNYILLSERMGQSFEKVKGIFEQALTSGFTQGSEYLTLWTTFIDYLRRRIKWDAEHQEELETFRLTIEKAIEQIDYYGNEGDPNGTLRQFWAVLEAKHCKNLEKARELWSEVMTSVQANEAALWMEYYRFERTYGDNKHCRRVLQRALNSVTDWPESIVDAYINFEREEGTLEQYDVAVSKCQAQMSRIKERREKAAEAEAGGQDKKRNFDRKGNRKFDKKFQGGKQKQKGQKQSFTQETEPIQPYKKKKMTEDTTENSKKETAEFKLPAPVTDSPKKSAPPPGFKGQQGKAQRSAPPPGFKGEGMKSAPPPGFKGKGEKSTPPPGFKGQEEVGQGDSTGGTKRTGSEIEEEKLLIKKIKTGESNERLLPHDSSKDFRTVFVSNLSYVVDEEQIKNFFTKCGEIDEIRLIKDFKGRSKGYAYVQFKDELPVATALSYDRTTIENRPMFVSKCEDRSAGKSQPQFKYSSSLEKNKLFVKNLPFTCTKEALQTLFGEHGELKDVRLVTYRSGQSKGLAYIEYVDEQTAAQALLKTDGIQIGEHTISVAISNPPSRKTPLAKREESLFVPSLGGGKKDTASHGHARTQLMLVPRALKQKSQPSKSGASDTQTSASESSSSTQTSAGESSSEIKKTTGMSNSDFRNLLLKK